MREKNQFEYISNVSQEYEKKTGNSEFEWSINWNNIMNLHLVHLSSLARVLIFIAYEIDLQKIGPIEMKWNEIFI